ncbi:MAG: PaaI family thioesterase [Acidimicrobiales bacterium]|nr:PaaI family thioesterase [Acidimicrobiales bacterium]
MAEPSDAPDAPSSTGFSLVVPFEQAWSGTVGLEVVLQDDGSVTGHLPITEAVCQPMGLVHGGIYACIGEELASVGTGRQVTQDGRWCLGQSNLTHFLRPGRLGGTLHGVGRPLHTGRTSWIWDVEIRDQDDRLCARSTVTMAVRDGTYGPQRPAP